LVCLFKFEIVDYKRDANGYVYETVYERVSDTVQNPSKHCLNAF